MKMHWKTALAVTAAVSYLSLATVSHGVFLKKPGDLVGTSTKVQPKVVAQTDQAPPEPQITLAAFVVATALAFYWAYFYGPPPNHKVLGAKSPEKMLEALP
jgi:hypothetical protein